MIQLLSAVTGWLLFAAVVTGVGSVVAYWVLAPRTATSVPGARASLQDTAARLGWVAALALPAAMLLVFVRQLVEFRDPFSPWSEEAALLLTGTSWGTAFIAATTAALVAVGAFALVRRGVGLAWWAGTVALLGVAAYPAFSGHASGTESLRLLTQASDVAHVWAAGAWVGGLVFVVVAERSWRVTGRPGTSLLPALVPVFSPVAIAAVATLVVTGSFASWVHVETFGDMVSTPYGRLLSLKMIAVLSVMGLGAVNWRRLTPRLGTELGDIQLRRSATVELVIAQIVLLITAVLVRTSPMGH